MNGWFAIDTPAAPGAVAVVRVVTDAGGADGFFEASGVRPVGAGASAVREVFGLDHALVVRPDARTVLIMPHGGNAIVRGIAGALEGLGLARLDGGGVFPESTDEVTSRMLETLARAASPLAIDLLLDQPRRWAERGPDDALADAKVLGRLIDPPVVVAVGAANIGKSSLLNALAGASVALAFDRAGTTRDAVGVLVDLGGLVVRWVDTPGIGPGREDDLKRVRAEIVGADLVVRCADAESAGPIGPGADHPRVITVATRADLGDARFEADVTTSTASGHGLNRLVAVVQDGLVPVSAMLHPGAWRFWGTADGDAVGA